MRAGCDNRSNVRGQGVRVSLSLSLSLSLSICIYIYIYIYFGVMSYPPPCFLTTLQYTKLHGKESLGIIFPKELKKTKQNMKKSKTNSKNINTGYLALDPTANKYLSGSGWEISVCLSCSFVCCSVFLRVVVMFVLLLYVFVRL